jgi:hypothetical protein
MADPEIIELIKEFVKLLRAEGIEVERAILVIANLHRADFELKRTLMRLAVRVDERLEPVAYSPQDFEQDNWLPLLYSIKTTGQEIDLGDV